MNRYLLILISVFLVAACSAKEDESSNADAETSDVITLRAATGNPETLPFVGKSFMPWMDKVEESSDGNIDFDFYTNGELVKLSQEIDGVLNGTVDVALGYPNYQPDQFPLSDVTMLPLEESDIFVATKAWKDLLESDVELSDGKTFYESQFGDKGLFVLPLSMSPPYEIATTKKTFDSISDLKGTSLRTPSSITETFAKELEIKSISMPGGEVYDALSRGSFDGTFVSVPDWVGLGIQDLLFNELEVNAGHFNAAIVMEQETFDNLSEKQQDILVSSIEDTLLEGSEEWDKWHEELIEEKIEDGATFTKTEDVSVDLQEYISDAKVETWKSFIESRESKGQPGKDVALLWRDLIVEAGGKVPEEIMEMD